MFPIVEQVRATAESVLKRQPRLTHGELVLCFPRLGITKMIVTVKDRKPQYAKIIEHAEGIGLNVLWLL